mgnify:CR=1 FL=1
MKYILNLRNMLEKLIIEENAFIIGEDIQEPYGGAFKVTKGLSERYPNNIIGTPMCEQGFTGMGLGMALQGCNVITEIMFGDFITLTCDQMINHGAKFHDMYNVGLHMVLRCPSGGYRGYGATHSQSLEKLYLGVPGIQVVAASIANSPGELLKSALDSGVPTLFVENKLDYPRDLLEEKGSFWIKEKFGTHFPIIRLSIEEEKPEWTIVTYGGLVQTAMEVMEYFLYEEEVNLDIIVLTKLNDFTSMSNIIRTKNVLVLEEGVSDFGWGSEIAYRLLQNGICAKKMGAKNSYIPASKSGEESVLVMPSDIINFIKNEGERSGQ